MNVEKYLNDTLKEHKMHITLIDPDEQTPEEAVEIAKQAQKAESDAILLGGSITDQEVLNLTAKELKENVILRSDIFEKLKNVIISIINFCYFLYFFLNKKYKQLLMKVNLM